MKKGYEHLQINPPSTSISLQMIDKATDGSITPRTLTSIEFIDNEGDNSYEYFRQKYSHTGTGDYITRFGINTVSEKLISEIKKFNNSVSSSGSTKSSSTMSRAIQEARNDKLKEKKVIDDHRTESTKKLTDIEINNVSEAIKHLQATGQKIVVVDMFDRSSDGHKVSFELAKLMGIASELELPKIHSVLLYSKDSKYLVIDPSNSSFSQILDIAVKLGFNLLSNLKIGLDNNLGVAKLGEQKQFIPTDELKNSISIQEITNQTDIDRSFPSNIQFSTIRAKQSSDVCQSKKVTAILRTIENISKFLESKFKGMTHSLLKLKQEDGAMMQELSTASDHEDFFKKWDQIKESSSFVSLTTEYIKILDFESSSIDQIMTTIGETNVSE